MIIKLNEISYNFTFDIKNNNNVLLYMTDAHAHCNLLSYPIIFWQRKHLRIQKFMYGKWLY